MVSDRDVELPATLSATLEVVLRDLTATGRVLPRVEDNGRIDHPGQQSAVLWSQDGSGLGIFVMEHETVAERICSLADQVQEWAVEDLWGRGLSTSCPHSGTVVAEVGGIG